MTGWSIEDLGKITGADDLHISPLCENGMTYGTPTWIWFVAVDGTLFVRAYNRQNSRWYQAAERQKAGRIIAAGMTKEVSFEPVAWPINDRIDDTYKAFFSCNYHASMVVRLPKLKIHTQGRRRATCLQVSDDPP